MRKSQTGVQSSEMVNQRVLVQEEELLLQGGWSETGGGRGEGAGEQLEPNQKKPGAPGTSVSMGGF